MVTLMQAQVHLDQENAGFWNMICGTGLAKHLGIEELDRESLKKFDAEFHRLYPYLSHYLGQISVKGGKVLEIGLGFGTVGQILHDAGADYHGLDIAPAPIELMQYRLGPVEPSNEGRLKVGSALDIPFSDGTFDQVISIGCLHHTGDLKKAIGEIRRVLKRGGIATLMLYHAYSYRRLVEAPAAWWRYHFRHVYDRAKYPTFDHLFRSMFDANADGEPCPHIEFVTKSSVPALMQGFETIEVAAENWLTAIDWFGGRIKYSREECLRRFARYMGHDLYIVARKS
jgi:ubiquinone/menaquinone biosynthesis C-methylase UbiE